MDPSRTDHRAADVSADPPDRDAAVFRGRPGRPAAAPGPPGGPAAQDPGRSGWSPERSGPPAGRKAPAPPRIAVIGGGAVGSYLAARAGQAGAEVLLCVRRGGFDRIRVESMPTGSTVEVPVRLLTEPAQLDQPVDWLVVATKAHQTPGARGWLRAALGNGRDVGVVVAQNGVRQADRVCPPMPRDAVLPAVVYINAELPEPGVVRHLAYGVLQVPDSGLGTSFAQVLPPGDVRLVDDFATAAWSKLLSNSAANSLTALVGRGLEVLARPDLAELALAVMRETAAVGRADGARIPADAPERTLERLRHQPAGAGTSMLRDRLAGRPLEHDALIGAVVRIGASAGVATPTCAALLPLLAAVNQDPDA
ncbi:ketopantoate reductase [Frankia sp. EI5c]|uniref:2-dehydropantoate 2-reductase n=1 Tax=Frankia sp. EI5c TaxID=683316 RepID=UPI0007C21224|nr:2-dehydropantoate 2-reductase [Frankia sp. EI5c]OAA25403.1 ketopantoate reductase [Frankia sp. EI5c]